MDKVPAAALTQQVSDLRAEEALRQKHGEEALRRLVEEKGWFYAKRMALVILKPYECDPAADAAKWNTYNTIRWAFERFFAIIERAAGKEKDDGNSPDPQQ